MLCAKFLSGHQMERKHLTTSEKKKVRHAGNFPWNIVSLENIDVMFFGQKNVCTVTAVSAVPNVLFESRLFFSVSLEIDLNIMAQASLLPCLEIENILTRKSV